MAKRDAAPTGIDRTKPHTYGPRNRIQCFPVPGQPLVRLVGRRGKFKLLALETNRETGATWAALFGPVAKGEGQAVHVRPGDVIKG